MPFSKQPKKQNDYKHLESLIFKKFHDRKSVSKIIQKTAKLQKNIETKLESHQKFDEHSGEAIRYCLNERIKSLQKCRAVNYQPKPRVRTVIHRQCLKLYYQAPESSKRKTRIFDSYDENELDFPDANNLLK